ncbi:MAG TPA: hypothetical protein VM008_06860 [Phycisphaerae bacterium]|nr:hypothetical protein [Phycisphaerae bacterium]
MPMLLFAALIFSLICFTSACQQPPHTMDSRSAMIDCTIPSVPDAATSTSPLSTSVRVYVELTIERKYNLLARVFGYANSTESRIAFDPAKDWWDNPIIVFADPVIPSPDATATADAAPLVGQGASTNVRVALTLTPHAEIAFRNAAKCDAIQGTITLSISTLSDYFDGDWTQMLVAKDRNVSFSFDTRIPGRPTTTVIHETRTLPLFVFQRYTRDHDRWDARTDWPTTPESGDFRITLVGKNATLHLTGYQYTPEITSTH